MTKSVGAELHRQYLGILPDLKPVGTTIFMHRAAMTTKMATARCRRKKARSESIFGGQ
ncbi:MAG: hypothetical protein KJ876_01025 [Alphaproteobacteria bacterium]|uniref:hypothetical protein n=1 Tax=Novosphingobium sp. SCN 63-17 TaxID=1660120 RepID=UPI0025FED660|nr:hypothetical protein [Novosphingobium sp. SCN 63-17]MBU0866730.1 hypothetical protein [Alphaproteobacteria bacterium]